MGRTGRKKRSKERKFETCDHHMDMILLNSWLASERCERNRKLVLTIFEGTGRGVLTKKKIHSGEELINLPLNLTINVTTILMDETFNQLFLNNKLNCLYRYKKSLSFQSLLALYLVHLRSQFTNSKWDIYIKSLPKEYTVPYFLPNKIKPHLPKDIFSAITKQKDIVDSSYDILKEIVSNSVVNESLIKLKEDFTRSEYEWAYFTVNTRCVYMDLSKIVNFDSLTGSILELISDNTNISLCPYLDMINHSTKARNETKLVLNKNIQELQVRNLNEEMFSDVRFILYTKNNIEAYNEVFICYGDSHNLKLVTEYGFFLPNNSLDSVLFEFDTVHDYLISRDIKLSQDQLLFIRNHGLHKDLYIDHKGLSFNFYGLLMVVKCYYKQNADVSRIIYSPEHICSDNHSLNELIVPLVKENIINIKNKITELENCEYKGIILNNCIALMDQYVKILEMFIKC